MSFAISPEISAEPAGFSWLRRVDQALRELSQRVTLLGAATPRNAREERSRLQALAERRRAAVPMWRYAALDLGEVRRRLEAIADALVRVRAAGDAPLVGLYEAKVRELELEARICECVGREKAGVLAAQRFASFGVDLAAGAERLAAWWIGSAAVPTWERTVPTDDETNPDSLLSLMRHEVGRRRIPFAVVVHPQLSALAATGNQTILIAASRRIAVDAARRTVMHEVEGHVLPRVRAAKSAIGLFALGTARGADEQEGYALVLEDRHGFLTAIRQRELAGRYLAVRAMREGAPFAEVVQNLVADGIPPRDAVVMAERAFRASDGTFPGLGRERVYLESYLRVRAHIAQTPEDEAVLASGQLALETLDTLRPYAATG
ncbi:tyrosine/phenylalanine carboxypeptidase domain-containing protein [Pendulispora albinea]|uniref:Flavohemoglobin expression-modulating QEGLA motif protein n=1 Tax=Pendulispora albinea TaxID=2741071 RepID=A0ABZ2LMX3_9BACT